jgi:hypothetical protein
MHLQRFWILLLLFTVTYCFAEPFPSPNKSNNPGYFQESMVTYPFKVSNLQYNWRNPFDSDNLVSDIVVNFQFDHNNNYKKIQDLGSTSLQHLTQTQNLYLTLHSSAYHFCMIKSNEVFLCKFQI